METAWSSTIFPPLQDRSSPKVRIETTSRSPTISVCSLLELETLIWEATALREEYLRSEETLLVGKEVTRSRSVEIFFY